MSDIDFPVRDDADAKAWFYLDNRADIETWVELRDDGAALLGRYLIALAPIIEGLAEELDAEVDTGEIEAGPWPRVGLRRSSWTHAGTADVSVVIQWERARLLKPGPNQWPFTAVLVASEQGDEDRRRQIAEALAPVRSALKGQKNYRWPHWRYEKPQAQAQRLDPEELALVALDSLKELWALAAPALDDLNAGRR